MLPSSLTNFDIHSANSLCKLSVFVSQAVIVSCFLYKHDVEPLHLSFWTQY